MLWHPVYYFIFIIICFCHLLIWVHSTKCSKLKQSEQFSVGFTMREAPMKMFLWTYPRMTYSVSSTLEKCSLSQLIKGLYAHTQILVYTQDLLHQFVLLKCINFYERWIFFCGPLSNFSRWFLKFGFGNYLSCDKELIWVNFRVWWS